MKVVCFSPNDAIWPWTLPQAQVLEALKQRGDQVIYVYCDREYSSLCVSMASMGIPYSAPDSAKAAACDICQRNSKLVRARLGFESRPLRSFMTDADRDSARLTASKSPISELIRLELEGVPVGKFALYETIIQTKSLSTKLNAASESYYRANIYNTILTAKASKRMSEELKPDIGISYHTAYAYNHAFQAVFEREGIAVWFLNASLNAAEYETHLLVARSDPVAMYNKFLADWGRFRDVPCTLKDIRSAADHLICLISGGGFAFSRPIERRKMTALRQLGCEPGKKVLLATLSSYDELLAAEVAGFGWSTHNEVFASQLEWIEWLFDYAKSRDDIHIIIRVHPREFPIKGIGERSEHSYLLEAAFARRPENVSINLPADEIALYDLLVESDVVLVAWSSVGMEAGMLGVPVVTYAGDVTLYPRSLLFDATSRAQYRDMIEKALLSGWSIERARFFFRWAVLLLARSRIGLSNRAKIPVRRNTIEKFGIRARNRILAALSPWGREWWSLTFRPRRLTDAQRIYDLIDLRLDGFQDLEANQPGESRSELDALYREIGRIARLIAHKRGYPSSRLGKLLAPIGR